MAEEVTPPLSKLPVEIGGICYHLCFDLPVLTEAEGHFIRQGYEVDLCAICSSGPTAWGLLTVFACAMRRCHPEVGFVEAQKLATLEVLIVAGRAMAAAVAAASKEALAVFCLRVVAQRLCPPTGIGDA